MASSFTYNFAPEELQCMKLDLADFNKQSTVTLDQTTYPQQMASSYWQQRATVRQLELFAVVLAAFQAASPTVQAQALTALGVTDAAVASLSTADQAVFLQDRGIALYKQLTLTQKQTLYTLLGLPT